MRRRPLPASAPRSLLHARSRCPRSVWRRATATSPPRPPSPRTQPAGVYEYATEGFERIGGPLPGRLTLPRRRRTIEVELSGCDLTERWEARPERWAEWRYCITGDTWRLRSVTDYHEFFGKLERAPTAASGAARAATRTDRARASGGPTAAARGGSTAVARGEVVSHRRRLQRRRARSGRAPARAHAASAGDVRGAYMMDSWLRRTDGLLLRRTFSSETRRATRPSGACPAHERVRACRSGRSRRADRRRIETAAGRVDDSNAMLIAAIIAFCILLFLVAILAPRISRHMERGGDAPLRGGQRAAGKAPGPLGPLAAEAVRQVPQGRPQERLRRAPNALEDRELAAAGRPASPSRAPASAAGASSQRRRGW